MVGKYYCSNRVGYLDVIASVHDSSVCTIVTNVPINFQAREIT